MRELRGNTIAVRLLVQDRCPFLSLDADDCRNVRTAEQRTRDEIRCEDSRHGMCFFYFVHRNRQRDQHLRRHRPDAWHNRPGQILCLDEPGDLREAG